FLRPLPRCRPPRRCRPCHAAPALTQPLREDPMTWLTTFPQLKSTWLRDLQRLIDDGFRSFTRSYGDLIEGFFSPLQSLLIWFERLLLGTPWPVILLVVAGLAWGASRSLRVVIGSVATLVLIGLFGMWDDTMKTISMVLAATLLSIAV